MGFFDELKRDLADTIVSSYEEEADQGNANAYYNLGLIYLRGEMVKRDIEQAISYFEKAGYLECAKAYYELGELYSAGEYVEKNYEKAVMYYGKAARLGDATAYYRLSYYFFTGESVEQDIPRAITYMEKAGDLGCVESYLRLALIYDEGNSVERDIDKSIVYLERIAVSDIIDVNSKLGRAYTLKGQECDESGNYEEGLEYYIKAAELGCVQTSCFLGKRYEEGYYGEKDTTKAVYFYEKAALGGNGDACFALGSIYDGTLNDIEKAICFYEKAVDLGIEEACQWLSLLYYCDERCEKDVDKAIYYAEKGLELGGEQSDLFAYYLGKIFLDEKDFKKAIFYYEKSASLGDTGAYVCLGDIYIAEGVNYNSKKAFECYEKAALKHNIDALLKLGFLLWQGKSDFPKDIELAISYYEEVKDTDSGKNKNKALMDLGRIYFSEDEVKDINKAIGYYKEAFDRRVPMSALMLSYIYEVEEDYEYALYYAEEESQFGRNEFVEQQLSDLRELIERRRGKVIHQLENSLNEQYGEIKRLKEELEQYGKYGDVMSEIKVIASKTLEIASETLENTKETNERTKELQRGFSDLNDYVRNDLPFFISEQKQALRREIKDNFEEQEQRTAQYFKEVSDYINDSVSKSNENDVKEANQHLTSLLGSSWDRLLDESKLSLVSARVLWNRVQNITYEFDYSGICISVTSALEIELKRLFFIGWQDYLMEIYGKPNLEDWPKILLYCSYKEVAGQKKFVVEKKYDKYFSLGFMPYIFGVKREDKQTDDQYALQMKRLEEYLATVVRKDEGNAIGVFTTARDGKSSFLDEVERIRNKYRNPAAHDRVVPYENARRCYKEVVGVDKDNALNYTEKVMGILAKLYTIIR